MLLIGIGNKARSGKDTAAQAIKNYYDRQSSSAVNHGLRHRIPTVGIYKFAATLYDECRRDYGMSEKDAPLLQRVGAERRAQDSEYWIKRCFDRIWQDKFDIVLISDTRYLNEAKFIKHHDGYLLNVFRMNFDGTQYIANDRPADHPSEIELDGYNWDGYIRAKSGQSALVGELAITTSIHWWGMHS